MYPVSALFGMKKEKKKQQTNYIRNTTVISQLKNWFLW